MRKLEPALIAVPGPLIQVFILVLEGPSIGVEYLEENIVGDIRVIDYCTRGYLIIVGAIWPFRISFEGFETYDPM
jgi:hypothetical protein